MFTPAQVRELVEHIRQRVPPICPFCGALVKAARIRAEDGEPLLWFGCPMCARRGTAHDEAGKV